MKLATVLGACFWKNWQVMRPIDVSMTTVGPLGWTMAAAVAWGASGSGSGAWGAGVVDCWATATATAKQAARVGAKRANLSFMPCLRVNHPALGLPAREGRPVSYFHEGFPCKNCQWALGSA